MVERMQLLNDATRNLFFSGKGGVGKTSTACAVAVALADRGKSVLLVSTDPASNLDEVFGTALSNVPSAIGAVPRLSALNVDPETAAVAYRERIVGPYRQLLPPDALASIEEQFSGACTVEIAAFDEFAKLLADDEHAGRYDHFVFDTAPTGHTLRLLSLPSAWSGFLAANAAGTSCVGPLQGLSAQKHVYSAAMSALADPARTTTVLVTRPERSAIREAARTAEELGQLGMHRQALVVNGVFTSASGDDDVAAELARAGHDALGSMPGILADLPRTTVPLKARQVIGVTALRQFFDAHAPSTISEACPDAVPQLAGLESLIDALSAGGPGVIMTMGKGGVGKTTIAARIAVALARRGHPVHLTTTDPAAHVRNEVHHLPRSLTIGQINPAAEVKRYRGEVLSTTGAKLDAQGRALLEEDLNSPCTEEIAVFQAFARTVAAARHRFVVIDTAPTGHTILLLDAAQAYHRELERQSSSASDDVRTLLPRLRNQAFTRIVLCTLAEATPVHEAAALERDLARAGIHTFAWMVNQSFVPLRVTNPLLASRRTQELRYLAELTEARGRRLYLVPWQSPIASQSATSAAPGLLSVS
jgi:arsenite-transporting ATPase